jgi:hypothetical protein
MGTLPRIAVFSLAFASLLASGACGSDSTPFDEGDGGGTGVNGNAACEGRNWRQPSDDVTCPGADSCGCTGGQACCLSLNGDLTVVTSSSCVETTACADVAFACDGPEDCSPDQDCCAAEFGSSCVDGGSCIGIDTFVFCRSDEDCGVKTCNPAQPGTYFDGAIGFCD